MPSLSAGLLLFRRSGTGPEVLLVHPGGPFWTRKDEGAWSVPKGLVEEDEDLLAAARREFEEETGFSSAPPFLPLGQVRLPSGKLVAAWAFEGEADPAALRSNSFSLEWPPRSGHRQEFPEIDRGDFFALPEARRKLAPAQLPFLDRLLAALAGSTEPPSPP